MSAPSAGFATSRVRVGTTVSGRSILARVLGSGAAGVRILLIAGQHGDEPGARLAAESLVDRPSEGAVAALARRRLGIAIIADANPDAAAAGHRANDMGVDLNRDHQSLSAPETLAVHRFVRRYSPHLVLDVHNFPSRRNHLLRPYGEIGYDVLLGTPTNPAIRLGRAGEWLDRLVDAVGHRLEREGYAWDRYMVFQRSGRVRPSTLTTRDARNTIALRYGLPTLLIEGRSASRRATGPRRDALRASLRATLDGTIDWTVRHPPPRRDAVPRMGERVPVRSRWDPPRARGTFRFLDPVDGSVRPAVRLPSVAAPVPEGYVPLPFAYAVPAALDAVRGPLDRHGFLVLSGSPGPGLRVEGGDASRPPPGDLGRPPHYRIYPTAQPGGRALALWLEPESLFGFTRPGPPRSRRRDRPFPVLRLSRAQGEDPAHGAGTGAPGRRPPGAPPGPRRR